MILNRVNYLQKDGIQLKMSERLFSAWYPSSMNQIRLVLVRHSEWLTVNYSYLSANVDASVMYRRWKESDGKDEEYKTIIIRQVKKSQEDAKKDNVTSKQ